MMRFEHLALNVPEPIAMARWYCDHCHTRVAIANDTPPYAHFLADATGRVILEIYCNREAPMPEYAAEHWLRFHLAFAVSDIECRRQHLLEAGAQLEVDHTAEDGSRIITLRDPWGVPLQLCQRAHPFGT